IGGDAMMSSMDAAGRGDLFTLDAGPALLGLAIHMMWGAVWGVVFFALARAAHLRGAPALILAGIVFGLVVMLLMSWTTLPITAEVVGGGMPIEEMATIVGWGTFSVEHVLFGLVPGVWAAARRKVAATGSATGSEERHEPRLAGLTASISGPRRDALSPGLGLSAC
ncbi:MAG: hypothetical protein ACRDJ5_07235, partial [Actinomycetota bacterium]